MNKGFTLVELMITVGIFVVMTGLMLAKYGNFNKGVLLTNLAYDIALHIRSVQSYGLNFRQGSDNSFTGNYSITFNMANPTSFDTYFNSTSIGHVNIKGGNSIQSMCVGTDASRCGQPPSLTITFNRPNPEAIISTSGSDSHQYARIVVQNADGSATKIIVIQSTGQIYVSN